MNKKIAEVQYNYLNLATRTAFEDGSTVSYNYAVDGTKLNTMRVIGGVTSTTDYCGSVIYEDGKYHYFLQDHQGNNRVVVNHYYPYIVEQGASRVSTKSYQEQYELEVKHPPHVCQCCLPTSNRFLHASR